MISISFGYLFSDLFFFFSFFGVSDPEGFGVIRQFTTKYGRLACVQIFFNIGGVSCSSEDSRHEVEEGGLSMVEDEHNGNSNENSNKVANQTVSEVGLGSISDCFLKEFEGFGSFLGLN